MHALQPVNDQLDPQPIEGIEPAVPLGSRDDVRPSPRRLQCILEKIIMANPEFSFAFDVLKKVLVCCVIALSACGIHALVDFLEHNGVPSPVMLPMKLIEYLVFIVDVLWVARVLVADVFESFRALLREAPIAKTSLAVTLLLLAAAATSHAEGGLSLLEPSPRCAETHP